MRPKRRSTKSGGAGDLDAQSRAVDDRAAHERSSRTEASVDVPRADDFVTTCSTHSRPLERRNEEPSDGLTPADVEGAT